MICKLDFNCYFLQDINYMKAGFMGFVGKTACLAAFIFASSSAYLAAQDDLVMLKGGASVKGEILKRDEKSLTIDLGYDVIRIPMSSVLEVKKEKTDGTDISDKDTDKQMYSEDDLKIPTTEEAVNKFSPSVLLIKTPAGLGSGFFINKDGYLATNFHVIKGERHISATQFVRQGSEMRNIVYKDVRIVAVDPFHDLAILKIEDPSLDKIVPVVFSPDDPKRTGETVFAIGNPLGLERTVTEGVISHVARNFGGSLFLQVDAPVNPGNSGGPLFNSKGQVIGVINMGVSTMEGLNFAIPARNLKFLLNNLDAFAFNESNPVSGFYYPAPPRRGGAVKEKSSATK